MEDSVDVEYTCYACGFVFIDDEQKDEFLYCPECESYDVEISDASGIE